MQPETKPHLSARDPILAKIIDQLPPVEHSSDGDVFHDLMSCVIEQQIHYRSTKKQFEKLLEKAGLERLTVDNFEVFEEKALAGVKLSGRKYETIARVLEFFQGEVPNWREMDDAEVRKVFAGIKGIGKWTVDMILLYTLERADIFPVDDYHLKLIMEKLYDMDPAKSLKSEMKRIAAEWSPNSSQAVLSLLAYKEAQKRRKA